LQREQATLPEGAEFPSATICHLDRSTHGPFGAPKGMKNRFS
jgi:hypothetical protein